MNIKIQHPVVLYALLAVSTAIVTHIVINWSATVADPLSYRMGMQIGANLRSLKLNINVASFMQGLSDGVSSENPTFTGSEINNGADPLWTSIYDRLDGGETDPYTLCSINSANFTPDAEGCATRVLHEELEYEY